HHLASEIFEHVVLCVLLLFKDCIEEAPMGQGVWRFGFEEVEYDSRFCLGHWHECRARRKHSCLDCFLSVEAWHVAAFEWSIRPAHVCEAIAFNLYRMK